MLLLSVLLHGIWIIWAFIVTALMEAAVLTLLRLRPDEIATILVLPGFGIFICPESGTDLCLKAPFGLRRPTL